MPGKPTTKVKWTERMIKDIIECKRKAKELISSSDPPCNTNGRKKGYIEVMKELWEKKGYGHLGLKSQNLRDQASRLEKMLEDDEGIRDDNTLKERNEARAKSNESDRTFEYNIQNNGSRQVQYANSATDSDLNMSTMDQTTSPSGLSDTMQSAHCTIEPNLPGYEVFPSEIKNKAWGNISHESFCNIINGVYDEIVHFRRNIFNVPSGRAGKSFIEELTFWLKQFNSNSELSAVALKAFMVLPTLILQKPSAKSKSKEHSAAIERRLNLWRQGDLELLLKEVRFIQGKFVGSKKARTVEDISKVFGKLVLQGKLSAAIKLLDRESSSGLLNLTPEVLEGLKEKHPEAAEIADESLLYGPMDHVPPGIFDMVDEEMIYDAATKTKGSAGPSGMDAELYCRILCSKNFKSEGKLLREEIAILTRNLLRKSYHPSLLEGYTSCRLIALDKNPGIRPIGIGEVLRRIVGKTITGFLKEEIKEAAGPLQVCAGHSAGSEAAIHAMSQVFEEEGTDGILLIDASNAFNQMNRSVALHNIQITCKEMALYIINTYRSPSRLFICGGGEILSQEGTTQGDPLAMPWYSVNTSIMIQGLRASSPDVKQVWLADDSAGGGRIEPLYNWYKHLSQEGRKYGYLVNGSKSWLIVKSGLLAEEAERVFGDEVNITTEGQRHLGAVIGSQEFKDQYCREKVRVWKGEIETLSEIAKSQPHAAYIAFTKGYKSKFTYFMRTIDSFEDYVDPVQEAIDDLLLPTLFGQTEPLPGELHQLVTLTPAQGGLGLPNLRREAPEQFAASMSITASHTESITSQSMFMVTGENSNEELKRRQQALKVASAKSRMENIDATLSPELLQSVNQARDKGASSWLNAVPLVDQGLALNKQEFRDSLRLRYNLPLSELPSQCACGEKFTAGHALSCKKGGFVAQRHDGVRNLLTSFISKVCTNVEVEPHLQPLDNERFHRRSTVTSSDARLDIKAGGFWCRGVTAFFDVRVTHVNSKCHQSKPNTLIFKEQEDEKKRKYQQRVLDVEMGSFTPLVFGTNGGMGTECQRFLKHLAQKLSEKNDEPYHFVISWLRTLLSFEILRSVHTCVRGSRTPFHRVEDFIDDCRVNVNTAGIH